MIGAHNTSLLHKLGQQSADEMPWEDLLALVAKEQHRRTISRGLTRLTQAAKKQNARAAKNPTLDQLGLAPPLIEKLRATGISEAKLIQTLREKGLI